MKMQEIAVDSEDGVPQIAPVSAPVPKLYGLGGKVIENYPAKIEKRINCKYPLPEKL